uniref:Uncharacterized protein n=1 Tax=Peronospora matthiolae TaxID=2874970 RepID=A0AAV1TUH2_9STRA
MVIIDPSSRRLRQQSDPSRASAPAPTQRADASRNPLRRRDPTLVAAHRVYDPVSGLVCALVEDCVACSETEKEEHYCRETGYRQELKCPRPWNATSPSLYKSLEDEGQTRFQPCRLTEIQVHGMEVLQFEAVMIALLVVSVLLLRRERRNHLTSSNTV